MVFADRFNCIEMLDLLPGICGASRQVISHGSGLARQVSLYFVQHVVHVQWYMGIDDILKKRFRCLQKSLGQVILAKRLRL